MCLAVITKIESEAGGDGEHKRMFAPVGLKDPALRREGPTQFRFYVNPQMLVEVELDAACAEQGEVEAVFPDSFSRECRPYAEAALDAAAKIDVEPSVTGQHPIQT